mgnify:CR=1 FL=1
MSDAPLRLAVFDCDGTLVDSQHSIVACMSAAFAAAGLAAPTAEADQQLGRIGAPDAEPGAYGPTWSDLADALSRWAGWPPWAAHGVLAAVLLLLAWWLLR